MTEAWQDRFKRAVADFAGVPQDVPLEDISVEEYSSDGYHYSSYTFEDPNIEITVRWDVFGSKYGEYRTIEGPTEIGRLIRSFLSPTE